MPHAGRCKVPFSTACYTSLFWFAWILAGRLIPLAILFHPERSKSPARIASACALVVVGNMASMYIIIGGQAYPVQLFPGKTILESGFYDGGGGGALADYTPTVCPKHCLASGGWPWHY